MIRRFLTRSAAFIRREELRLLARLLIRESMTLSLIALVFALSLESILPGTVSLRFGIIFFVMGILLAVALENALAHNSKNTPHKKESLRTKRFLIIALFAWSIFIFGNALIGFHPVIIAVVLVMMISLVSLLFGFTRRETVSGQIEDSL